MRARKRETTGVRGRERKRVVRQRGREMACGSWR